MSALADLAGEYLALRRALGYKLVREGRVLPRFVGFLDAHGQSVLTTRGALEWVTASTVGPLGRAAALRLQMIGTFAAYVRARDPRTEVPPRDIIPSACRRQPPYLYSAADITALLAACQRLRGRRVQLTYHTVFGLLAVTGLRVGEAVALDRADVDEAHARLIVRHTKFNKSREVPLHATTVDALHRYAVARDRAHPRPQRPSFFVSRTGRRLLVGDVWRTFDRVRRWAGLPRSPRPPRLHDLRHSFATHTLLRWAGDGGDVTPRLPVLATYLGHVSPASTYRYLTATPGLLELAAQRMPPWQGARP